LAPHFVLYVKQYLEDQYGKGFFKKSGLKIYTTLDLDLQNKAQSLIEKQVKTNIQKF
jgi:membrane peptidoglycan carboxypeptidase